MFQIDFFELCFLAEACEPPQPIAREMFWHKLVNEHFHLMSKYERARLHKFMEDRLKNNKNRDILMLLARYDPDNQYEYEGSPLFFFEGEYYFKTDEYLQEQYKSQVKKIC